MSISNVNEVIEATRSVDKFLKNYSSQQINRWIRTIAALIVLLVWLNCLNAIPFSWKAMPLWGKFLEYIVNKCYLIAILNAISTAIIYTIPRLAIWILKKLDNPHTPFASIANWVLVNSSAISTFQLVMRALLDFIGAFFSLYYLLFAVNLLVEFCNGYNGLFTLNWIHLIGSIYTIYIIVFIVAAFLGKRYGYYKHIMNKKYKVTRYVDSNGERIYLGDTVIYRGKMYKVALDEREVNKSKKYILSWQIENETVFLEEALQDKDGGIAIMK